MEVWIENTGMVELLTPAFATEYLTLTRWRGAHGGRPAAGGEPQAAPVK